MLYCSAPEQNPYFWNASGKGLVWLKIQKNRFLRNSCFMDLLSFPIDVSYYISYQDHGQTEHIVSSTNWKETFKIRWWWWTKPQTKKVDVDKPCMCSKWVDMFSNAEDFEIEIIFASVLPGVFLNVT